MRAFSRSLQNWQMSFTVHLLPTPGQNEEQAPSRGSKQSPETGSARRYKCPSMQVPINGPEPGTREALEVINKAKEMWVSAKPRRKLPKKVVSVLVRDQGVQANLIEDLDSEPEQRVDEEAEVATVEESMQCEEQAPVNVEEADLHQLIEVESAFGLAKDLDDSDDTVEWILTSLHCSPECSMQK